MRDRLRTFGGFLLTADFSLEGAFIFLPIDRNAAGPGSAH
jgi:hypothetical protein